MSEDKPKTEIATFAGGCFWCTEAFFLKLKGVSKVQSGYTGGRIPDPTYKQVCTGTTGHAEGIQITFDPAVISYEQLLDVFFHTHDPTTLNRQGADIGTQYRSAVFYANEKQKQSATTVIQALDKEGTFDDPIVTTLEKLTKWYPAENYHQNYYEQNKRQPYCQFTISPKVAKFQKRYAKLLKDRL
ncbi:UNVERIFIED_CONTAM: hypothetical protein GTU68_017340 [Idotea baltica]|nr:hypothetical protein [Idotea baltica]